MTHHKGRIQIYTDGASYDEMNFGAWAAIVIDSLGDRRQRSGIVNHGKSSIAELTAIIEALRMCSSELGIDVHTDHQPIIMAVNGQSKPKYDIDIWNELFSEIKRFKHGVSFYHVTSTRSGGRFNAECHRLVTSIILDRHSHYALSLYEKWAEIAPDRKVGEIRKIVDEQVKLI